jgi:hypothetical protein
MVASNTRQTVSKCVLGVWQTAIVLFRGGGGTSEKRGSKYALDQILIIM